MKAPLQTRARRRRAGAYITALLLSVVAVSFFIVDGPQHPAYAKRKSCTDCHKDIKKKIKTEKAHAPAKKSCETCHKRHGFKQQLVLVKEAPDLCIDCHKPIEKELAGENVHGALSEGGCTICHDPHASDEKAFLREAKGTPSVCVFCHKEQKELLAREDTHEPYRKRDCSACHAPHSSSQQHLLVSEEEEICSRCHKDVASKHEIPSFARLSCNDCHDPHLASPKQPLRETSHVPFASGECQSCHAVKGAEVDTLAGLVPEDPCAVCHDEESATMAGPESHPGEGGADVCLECHEPHNSALDGLKKADEGDLCRKCHGDLPRRTEFRGDMHKPYLMNQCSSCHLPHGGGGESHLVAERRELCKSCHEDKMKEPGSGEIVHPAMESLECMECHQAHMSGRAPLLARSDEEMCLKCHEKEQHGNAHPPYLTLSCSSCHKNHARQPGLLAKEVVIVCAQCHREQARMTRAPVEHPPAAEEECTGCHQPHGGEAEKLLVSPEKELCGGCHDLGELVAGNGSKKTRATLHASFAEGRCGDCHNPHGSDKAKLLVREGADLCYGCHTQERVAFSEGNIHTPVRNDQCGECHTPHGSTSPALMVAPQPELCLKCHDLAAEPLKSAHGSFDVAKSECAGCHNPHTSTGEKLLNDFSHPPFAEGSCDACHEEKEGAILAAESSLGLPQNVGELCISCHYDIASESGHHKKEGASCNDCHDPHASADSTLLDDPARLCLRCHENVVNPPVAEGASLMVHKPIQGGNCLKCHKMHGGVGDPFLVRTQDELCSMCHESIKEREDDRTKHAPFAKGRCSSCHTTHVSLYTHLLKKDETKLCKTCHSLSSKKMQLTHGGIPLTGEGCITCHDPHSMQAADSHLIPPAKHAPMAEGECSSCHDVLEEKGFTNGLCLECHDSGDNVFANVHPGKTSPGPAGKASSCLACHSPHAGYDALLKRDGEKATCIQCHDRNIFSRKVVHAIVEEGCTNCHDPHNFNQDELVGNKVIELCQMCHEQATMHAHPMGTKYVDPRTNRPVTCISCHEAHSSDHEFVLSFDRRRDLCVQCHASGTMRVH